MTLRWLVIALALTLAACSSTSSIRKPASGENLDESFDQRLKILELRKDNEIRVRECFSYFKSSAIFIHPELKPLDGSEPELFALDQANGKQSFYVIVDTWTKLDISAKARELAIFCLMKYPQQK